MWKSPHSILSDVYAGYGRDSNHSLFNISMSCVYVIVCGRRMFYISMFGLAGDVKELVEGLHIHILCNITQSTNSPHTYIVEVMLKDTFKFTDAFTTKIFHYTVN